MHPPVEREDAITDEDSDNSDDPGCEAIHLPRRLLNSEGQLSEQQEDEDFMDQDTQKWDQGWTKEDTGLIGSKIPNFVKPTLSDSDRVAVENAETAYDYYLLFSTPEWINSVLYNSKLYGQQREFGKKNLDHVTLDTLR